MSTTRPTHSHRIVFATAAAMMTALPLGLVAVPATAETVAAVEHGWQEECDHNGPMQWQQNRGRWEYNNCDNVNGHWERRGDPGRQEWLWHRDFNVTPVSLLGSA